MTLSDKTGAPVAVTRGVDRFTVEVEGKTVGLTAFADYQGRRVFHHTEVGDAYGGRGLATVLIAEALKVTRTDGSRIVAVCPMVAAYVGRHHEFDGILDAPTPELLRWLQER